MPRIGRVGSPGQVAGIKRVRRPPVPAGRSGMAGPEPIGTHDGPGPDRRRAGGRPKTRKPRCRSGSGVSLNKGGGVQLSHPVSRAVPSALEGLTSLFGMGRGVTPPPKPPHNKMTTDTRRGKSTGTTPWIILTDQASRLISTGRLKHLRALHLPPIDVVISNEPSGGIRPGIPNLGVCFALRGFQRLSLPNIATRQCPWQNNR